MEERGNVCWARGERREIAGGRSENWHGHERIEGGEFEVAKTRKEGRGRVRNCRWLANEGVQVS